MNFRHISFGRQLKTMLKVDFRRIFTMPLVYIMVAACLLMPILILVMTTMMDGSVSVDPTTGAETVIEAFDSPWQILGSVSGAASSTSMDMMSMCNINLLYFLVAVLVCIFTADDFRSGYSKNLFTVRANKADYVASKTLVCFVGGCLMVLGFFVGTILGGAFSGLPFSMVGFGTANLILCLLAKMLLMLAFVPIYLCMSLIARQRLWLSILLSMMVGMFLFMIIPMLTPLDSTFTNIILCLAGGVLFGAGLGAVGNAILKKRDLV